MKLTVYDVLAIPINPPLPPLLLRQTHPLLLQWRPERHKPCCLEDAISNFRASFWMNVFFFFNFTTFVFQEADQISADLKPDKECI